MRRRKTCERAARKYSATNSEPLDQRLVTRFIDSGEIVQQLPPLRHELEQSTPGMVVLDVSFEMLGQAVDAFREDGHLHFRRSGIAGFGGIGVDHFGLAAGLYRHRNILSC